MTSNDLLFLVIFIIVPTAAIVSGFWYLLVVRRTPKAPRVVQTENDRPAQNETAISAPAVETIETPEPAPAQAPETPIILADLNTLDSEESEDAQAIGELSPMTADLLADSDVQGDEDQQTSGISDEEERRALWQEIEQSPAGLTATEEIPEWDDEAVEDSEGTTHQNADDEEVPLLPHEQNATEQWEVDEDELRTPEDESPEPSDDDSTGELVDPDLDEDSKSDGAEDDEDDGESRQRARLMPAEPVKRPKNRKGRQSGRRVPRIPRLRRNEGRVERGDGPDDVPL